MASKAGAIRAGRAFVELFADDSRLVRGLRVASRKLQAWGRQVSMMGRRVALFGAAITGALVVAARQFASAGDELDKMSQRLTVSVKFLSALAYAAEIGGADISAMETGIRRLQRAAYDAAGGSKSAADAFKKLGVNIRGAKGQLKSSEQLFTDTAAALSKVENNTEKAALATILFGRAGTGLLPMLSEGNRGLTRLMKEAERLGLVWSTRDTTAAANLTDAFTRLYRSLQMIVIRVGGAVAPILEQVAEYITKISVTVRRWIDANKPLFQMLLKVGAAIAGVGAAVWALGPVLAAAGTLMSVLAVAATMLGTVLSSLIGVLSFLGSSWGFIILIVGAVAGAVGGLVIDFKALWATIKQFGAWLAGWARQIWNAIGPLLSLGEFSAAMKTALVGIKAMWAEAMVTIRRYLADTLAWASSFWTKIQVTVMNLPKITWEAVKLLFMQAVQWIGEAFIGLIATLRDAIHSMFEGIMGSIYDALGSISIAGKRLIEPEIAKHNLREKLLKSRGSDGLGALEDMLPGEQGIFEQKHKLRDVMNAAKHAMDAALYENQEWADGLLGVADAQKKAADALEEWHKAVKEANKLVEKRTIDEWLRRIKDRLMEGRSRPGFGEPPDFESRLALGSFSAEVIERSFGPWEDPAVEEQKRTNSLLETFAPLIHAGITIGEKTGLIHEAVTETQPLIESAVTIGEKAVDTFGRIGRMFGVVR